MKENRDFQFLEIMGELDEDMIEESLKPWEEEKEHKRIYFIHQITKRVLSSAAILAVVFLVMGCAGIVHMEKVQASIFKFTTTIGEIFHITDDLSSYADTINKTQTKEGVSVTLKEVILTQNRLLASFQIAGDVDYDEIGVENDLSMTLNGKKINCVFGGIYSKSDLEQDDDCFVMEWGLNKSDTPKTISDVGISINVTKNKEDKTGQDFQFIFAATKSELEANTLNMDLNKSLELKSGEILHLNHFSLNRLDSTIEAKCDDLEDADLMYYLIGVDSLGNEFRYNSFTTKKGKTLFILDEGRPSLESSWLDVQLYMVDIPFEEEKGGKMEQLDDETYAETSAPYSIDESTLNPVTKKTRINIK